MRFHRFIRPAMRGLVIGAVLGTASMAAANDWPHWRGPNHNGTADAANMPGAWTEDG